MASRRRPEPARALGEFGRIARFFAPLAGGARGADRLRDDCALLAAPSGRRLVLKTDTIVDTIHLIGDEPPELAAQKALRVNLSDLACKGATPLGYLLALSLKTGTPDRWVERFAKGLARDQKAFGLALLGGDTTHTPGPTTISVTILGTTARRRIPRRGDARPGDEIWVTGTIGDAALGLRAARGRLKGVTRAQRAFLGRRYRLPEPRLAAGKALAPLVHAAMDVSDGLVGDLAHIARHSRLDARIDWESVPLSGAARAALAADPRLRAAVLGGGDDYELLVTASPRDAARIAAAARRAGVAIARIGRMGKRRTRSPEVSVVDATGRDVTPARASYTHA